ncbi:MAG: glycosyltransferase, partial [Bacteroidales bacterium]|nr:glycosyltransferase [Bacteroidales bacterium]
NAQIFSPKVSVIIPVYNDYSRLKNCLSALRKQDYPSDLIEIIVVDNKSNYIPDWISEQEGIQFLREGNRKSSYAARNTGIRNSSGDILAFIDADCEPCPDWIQNGVLRFKDKGIEVLAGAIMFTSNGRDTFWEGIDSKMHLQQSINASLGSATTANLFVRRGVFDQQGLFPEWRSGADSFWVEQYTKGNPLEYEASAVVKHPKRGFSSLLKKRWRIGYGMAEKALWQKMQLKTCLKIFFKRLVGLNQNVLRYFPLISGKKEKCSLYLMVQISNFSFVFQSIIQRTRKKPK